MSLELNDSQDEASQHKSDSDASDNISDISSDSRSDFTGSERSWPTTRPSLKRSRAHRQSFNRGSSHGAWASDDYSGEGALLQRDRKRKRRQTHGPKRDTSPSLFPFDKLEDGVEIDSQSLFQSSERDTGSQLQSSDGPDSASDVDWESFLCDNIEMLPPSNWETDFLVHQAQVMARFDYRGLRYYDMNESNEDDDSGDEPWHPYDPESILADGQTELHIDSTNEKLEGEQNICYGVIHKRAVKVLEYAIKPLKQLQSMPPISESLMERKLFLFKVLREDKSFLLKLPTASKEELVISDNIAVLNKGDTEVLADLAGFATFEAYSSTTEWDSIANGETPIEKQTCLFADIIIYGPKRSLQDVGRLLDGKKIFLQEPDYRDHNFDYINPHMLDLSAVHPEPQSEPDQSCSSFLQLDAGFQDDLLWQIATPQSFLKDRIATAFKNMTRAQSLKRIAADIRIRTSLKPYQEEALDFIMQRESGPIPEEYCLWKSKHVNDDLSYTHALTGCKTSYEPVETGGGILADEMGLGKTLTMLSATIRTADEAKAFACNTYGGMHLGTEHVLIPSRATLVVTPSPCKSKDACKWTLDLIGAVLLNEWMQEIKLHCDGFSNIVTYHGHGREGDAKALANSDIVLSTYHTISHEASDKESPLWQIKWFRIVLDEAHIIRRMSTKLFKAMKKLCAKFYWCLTGTPVQNSLEDLAALISFIRAAPLDDLHKFRKHVIKPLTKGSENGVENLRQLLDSVCLRRTKQLLNLPEAVFELHPLHFSAREELLYNDTRDKLVKLINKNSLKSKNQKGYLGVFQLQLQLRRLCNHGTFQRASLETDEFDPDQAIALLKKQKIAKCEACAVTITGIQGIEEKRNGSFTVCGHLLCMKCVPRLKSTLKSIDGRDGCFQCSLCPEIVFGNYLVDEECATNSKRGSKNISAWQYFDKEGCSTKVSTIVNDIEHHNTEGKSIIFSCWTRSLDLVGIFLQSRKIPFVRIDGSHSLGQRKWILENYQRDSVVKILLMTTGTGAVGLNLTIANCVYLLEPQWNPMVENQAIARVLRLGQKRNVRVVRYIMKGTVEEVDPSPVFIKTETNNHNKKEMRSQQIRKLEFAKAGWKENESN